MINMQAYFSNLIFNMINTYKLNFYLNLQKKKILMICYNLYFIKIFHPVNIFITTIVAK